MSKNNNRPTAPASAANAAKQQPPPAQNQTPAKPPLSSSELLKAWFTSHGQSEDQQNRSQAIRDGAFAFGQIILKNTAPSADQTAALRKLREASATLIQGISLEEVGK